MTTIPGYTYGTSVVASSPVALADFELMKKTVLFGEEDVEYLRMSNDILSDQIDAILDVWYGFVGSQPHLLGAFSGGDDGKPLTDYLTRVRARFGQWIRDTARAEYDQQWLDYQHEIGLRHHRTKKNATDGAAAPPVVAFRDLFLLIYPVTFTLRPFLAKKGHAADEVDQMHAAWMKSCLLQLTLWSRPYVREGDF